MALEEEAVLVGHDAEHPVHPFLGELGHGAAAGADEMAVVAPPGVGLEAAGAGPEVVGAGEAGLDQEIEGAVEGRGADPMPFVAEPPLQGLDREVRVGGEEGRRDPVALGGDGKTMIAQPPPELLQELGRGGPTELHS